MRKMNGDICQQVQNVREPIFFVNENQISTTSKSLLSPLTYFPISHLFMFALYMRLN